MGALVGWRLGDQPALAAWIYLGGIGVVLAYVDACTRLLPTRLVAPSYAVVCALVSVAAAIDADPQRLLRAAFGWLAMGGFYFLLWFVYPRGMGYGDVRLLRTAGYRPRLSRLGALGDRPLRRLLARRRRGRAPRRARCDQGEALPVRPVHALGSLVGVTFGSTLGGWYASR